MIGLVAGAPLHGSTFTLDDSSRLQDDAVVEPSPSLSTVEVVRASRLDAARNLDR
jgi:hypothetical protein